ncbi:MULTISPECIES: hypothetical protein [Sphingomonadaceae]|uniref:Uncharacterized protein n=3 Tax=Sphingobium TaxID=165695 RepID=A0A7W6BNB8_9SPHN|nr:MULTISPECIES: hypothetical protein [Sphingomonadaceae]MBJ7439440.1 hypothetical protein [Sphingopyxis sp.]TNE44978.1 MAG: hypothetical protein EP345_01985 [Sphingomonadales bacterium]MBB3928086.1 hypothetical protein [Sphingobium jiangsuense]MBD3762789.1 hypothetical protein [Rhizorhabdus sp.]MBP8231037.1 hypothetical protein [Rhizorhabdus sp.]
MPCGNDAPIPAAPRKTLLEWIEHDDGNTSEFPQPSCSAQAKALHARILPDPDNGKGEAPEPLQPPPGLRLAPLG